MQYLNKKHSENKIMLTFAWITAICNFLWTNWWNHIWYDNECKCNCNEKEKYIDSWYYIFTLSRRSLWNWWIKIVFIWMIFAYPIFVLVFNDWKHFWFNIDHWNLFSVMFTIFSTFDLLRVLFLLLIYVKYCSISKLGTSPSF